MDLGEMRTLVRRDLHDEDASAFRWTDAELDRHIQHAVKELGLSVPLQATTSPSTTAGSRDLSLGGIVDLIRVEAVEYPIDKYPPVYVRFSSWAGTLTMLIEAASDGGETVRLYYIKLHTLDATSSTIPTHLEDLVATGAAAYSALEWSSFATNRVNVGGPETWRNYQAWGKERLVVFQQMLKRLAANNSVRARHLYVPAAPRPSQSTDWGPG